MLIDPNRAALIIADVLNCEYQAGGDSDTLVSVAHALSRALEFTDSERRTFEDVASMGGLPVIAAGRTTGLTSDRTELVYVEDSPSLTSP